MEHVSINLLLRNFSADNITEQQILYEKCVVTSTLNSRQAKRRKQRRKMRRKSRNKK